MTTQSSGPDLNPDAAWQDGYNLGLAHGEKLAGKPSVWPWILLGAGVVIGIELMVVIAAFVGVAAFSAS
ncbi:hypothetical protein [Rhodococcus sp. BH5]|uniref:hypothetical protein n=1 Tax=Rhodococcus sp. BH5 TaxID=2871702 RepID=UPI0022CD32EC|nr:hypothetical protein [Rhodococcus sp. BH5]MCZ9634859.1 hypothetical protein [Rhodococcus sp. BH5]